jgi:outer membrane protein insertion porin family
MKRTFFLLLPVFLLLAGLSAAAQKFQPKTIQFKGAPEYSNQELLNVADLKLGDKLNFDDMNAHTQKLMDTGLFHSIVFKFDGVDLVYSLVPSDQLYAVRLENLPLAISDGLEQALHARFPLYRGKVPSEGGLMEQVRQALEEMLAANVIKASVTATPYTDQKLRKVTAMSYAITSPPVLVGEIRLNKDSAPLDAKATEILARLTGSIYNSAGSASQIGTNLGVYYQDKGYLEAEVYATPANPPVVTPDAIRIPFQLSVTTGPLYKIAEVRLTPGLLVSQADFDHQSHIHPGDIATSQYVRENWQYIERQYHNKGYMKAAVHATTSLDHAQGTASFTVSVEPGPVYTMGNLSVANVSEELRQRMIAAWKLPAGAVFDESAVRSYYAIREENPTLGRIFSSVYCKYVLTLNDETHTVDVALRLEKLP